MPAKRKPKKIAKPEEQFATARQMIGALQKLLYDLCITPDPTGPDGKPLTDENGKAVKAKEFTDTFGKTKAAVGLLADTYKETLRDATGSAVPKTPISVTVKDLGGLRRGLQTTHRKVGSMLDAITKAEQSYKEQLQVAQTSLAAKRAEKRDRALALKEQAEKALAELETA